MNLAAGDGHPAEIMDMSFAIQALSALYLVRHKDEKHTRGEMTRPVPKEIDLEVASRILAHWGCSIDALSDEQHRYLYGD